MPPIDFMTLTDAALFLGISAAEVESLVADRVFNPFRRGNEVLVSQRQAELFKEGLLRRPRRKNPDSADQTGGKGTEF